MNVNVGKYAVNNIVIQIRVIFCTICKTFFDLNILMKYNYIIQGHIIYKYCWIYSVISFSWMFSNWHQYWKPWAVMTFVWRRLHKKNCSEKNGVIISICTRVYLLLISIELFLGQIIIKLFLCRMILEIALSIIHNRTSDKNLY